MKRTATPHAQEILDELYILDPALKAHATELERVVVELLRLKPDTKIDDEFKAALWERLAIRTVKRRALIPTMPPRFVWLTGAVCLVLVAGSGYVLLKQGPGKVGISRQPMAVERLGKQAFGGIAYQGSNAAQPERSGGGSAATTMAFDSGLKAAPSAIQPVSPTIHKYVYKGGSLAKLPPEMDVLKRSVANGPSMPLRTFLKDSGFALLDAATLKNGSVQNMTVKDGDYLFTIDQNMVTVSVSRFRSGNAKVATDIAPSSGRVGTALPPKSDLIRIADSFLSKYGISKDGYGSPEVLRYEEAGTGEFPSEVLSVLYPLNLNGKEVYESYGEKAGLRVEVNVGDNKVEYVQSIRPYRFLASAYKAETDNAKIIGQAESGNMLYGRAVGTELPDLNIAYGELGTPVLAYTVTRTYTDGQEQELMVPAYVFPVTKQPDGSGTGMTARIVVPVIPGIPAGTGAAEVMPYPAAE